MTRLSRVTNTMQRNVILQDIRRNNASLLQSQQELSSGRSINRPSDNPVGATLVMRLENEIKQNEQFMRNQSQARNFLSASEVALDDLNNVVSEARTIMLREMQDTASAETRRLSATEVNALLDRALAAANRQFNGRFLFGGTAVGSAPFEDASGYVRYAGNGDSMKLAVDATNSIAMNITGSDAFGALTTQVVGDVDLNPDITYGGLVSNATGGTVNTLVDTSLIGKGDNAFVGLDVRFTTGPNAGQSRRVTAFDNATGTLTFAGPALGAAPTTEQYQITGAATKIKDLNGGRGVDGGRFRINDGLGTVVDIDIRNMHDVADIVNAINADPTLNVRAGINATGDGFLLTPTVAGANITVSELDGGRVAQQLGIFTNGPAGAGVPVVGADLDPALTLETSVGLLNGGAGFDQASGMTIQNGPNTQTVTFDTAHTLNDIFNIFKNAGVDVTPRLQGNGSNSIDLVSSLNGTRFLVTEGAGSTASDLGLLMDPNEISLDQINGGLGISTVTGADIEIRAHDGTTFTVDLSNAKTLDDVVTAINSAAGNGGAVTASLMADPMTNMYSYQLTDNTVGAGNFEVLPQNGSFAGEGLGIQQNAGAGNNIASADLNVVGVQSQSIFTALIQLRDALLSGDREAIGAVGDDLDAAEDTVLSARAEIGGRLNQAEAVGNRLDGANVSMLDLISRERDVDLAEVVVKFQQQQTILQAGLSAAGQVLGLSLLDFI